METQQGPSRGRPAVVRHIRAAAHLLLSTVVAPRLEHVLKLDPEDDGSLVYVTREEAKAKGLPVYTGRVCSLAKPFRLRGAPFEFGCVRFTDNGLSSGQVAVQKIIARNQGKPNREQK